MSTEQRPHSELPVALDVARTILNPPEPSFRDHLTKNYYLPDSEHELLARNLLDLYEQLEALRTAGHGALRAWQFNRRDIASAMTDLAVALDGSNPASEPQAFNETVEASIRREWDADSNQDKGPRA